jgi:hypothetical protein
MEVMTPATNEGILLGLVYTELCAIAASTAWNA